MNRLNKSIQKNRGIHPLAHVERGAAVGRGTQIWQFSIVKKGAHVGKNCNIGAHCYIEAGSHVGDGVTLKNEVALWEGVWLSSGVFIGPNAIFTNDVYPRSQRIPELRAHFQSAKTILASTEVGYGATIGAGAMVLAGVTIGRFATVGLGAVVTKSVLDHALVVGNPARQIGWVCECGLPLRGNKSVLRRCELCRKEYKASNHKLQRIKSKTT